MSRGCVGAAIELEIYFLEGITKPNHGKLQGISLSLSLFKKGGRPKFIASAVEEITKDAGCLVGWVGPAISGYHQSWFCKKKSRSGRLSIPKTSQLTEMDGWEGILFIFLGAALKNFCSFFFCGVISRSSSTLLLMGIGMVQ